MALSQSAAKQTIDDPNLPPGSTATLTSLESKGDGEIQLDLTRLLPAKAEVKAETTSQMAVEAAGQQMTMDMAVQVTSTLTSK